MTALARTIEPDQLVLQELTVSNHCRDDMPIYEYTCRGCGTSFDRRLRMEERLQVQECPSCGRAEGALRMSAPALIGGAANGGGAPVCPTSGTPCTCGHAHH
jgi:putative FmdB family regulatory protein